MIELGSFLKQRREELHLSMKRVQAQTGITNSKLSRIEHGEGSPISFHDLTKLSELYQVNLVQLYLVAGYLTEKDLSDYRFVFNGADLLNKEEHDAIQKLIDSLTAERTVENNAF